MSLVSVITIATLLIYGNTMKFFDILQKIVSLLIAATYVVFAIYGLTHGFPLCFRGSLVRAIWLLIAWLTISLGFIWFSEDISEWLKSRPWKNSSDWTPPGLVRFAGWVMLLIPAITVILGHYKVFALLLR